MKLLLKDQIRKIKHNLFNFISLSLLVLIISFTYTSVQSSIRRLDENHKEYLESQEVEDFYFSMGEIDVNYLSGASIFSICRELGTSIEIQCAMTYKEDDLEAMNKLNVIINEGIKDRPDIYEELTSTYIEEFSEDNDFIVEKNIIVNITEDDYFYKFISLTNQINIPYIVEGRIPSAINEIALFPDFLTANHISIGDTYTIDDKDYLVTGSFYKPEFLFPIMSMDQIEFDPSTQTLVLTTEETINTLEEAPFTKYLVRGDLSILHDEFGYEDVQSGDYSFLGKNMNLVDLLMPRDINFRIITLDLEIENAEAFINIFLPVFILFIIILLLLFMIRYIGKNKEDIFTLHALGYTKREITLSILVFPFLISLHSLIGYILGLLASNLVFPKYSARYLFPKADFTLYGDIFIYAVILPIIVILLLEYILIYRKIDRKKKSKKIRIKVFSFTPLKTVIQTSLLFITISIMILFGLNGNNMFKDFIDHTKLGNNYHTMINLQYMTNEDLDSDYETYSYTATKIIEVNSRPLKESQSSTLYGIKSDNSLKLLINNDPTNNLLLEEGVIISEYLESKLNLHIGDSLVFTIGKVRVEEEIVGVSNELLENNLYMLQSTLNHYYKLDDTYYNGLYTTDDLYESNYIVSRITYTKSIEEFGAILNISSIIINFLVILSVIVSVFIFILVILNYFADNLRSMAILKSLGYNKKEINILYMLILYISLLLSYLIAIPITQTLLQSMLEVLMDTVGFKLVLDLSIINIFIGFVIINILFTVVLFSSNRYYDKIEISHILKKEQ